MIALLPYFFIKAILNGKYREGIAERFGFIRKEKLLALQGATVVWVHAVSVGETKAVVPVLRLLKANRPDVKIVFSTVTKTGNRTAEADCKGLIDCLIYFPLDLSCVVARVARSIAPSTVVIVEKEFWPNFILRMHRAKVPVVVINGAMSDRSFARFKRFGFFFRDVFGKIAYFAARTPEDRDKAIGVGVAAELTANIGNIKFDMKPPALDKEGAAKLASALGIDQTGAKGKIIVAGSTHAGEEEILIRVYRRLAVEQPSLKLIMAPRHPERFAQAEALLKASGLKYASRSKGASQGAAIVMLDTVGELLRVYSFADAAIVCGSLVPGIGGHNLLEPAMLGVPVVYGSHVASYEAMAKLLEAHSSGFRANNEDELYDILRRLLSSPDLAMQAGRDGLRAISENQGAAKKAAEIIAGFVKSKSGRTDK